MSTGRPNLLGMAVFYFLQFPVLSIQYQVNLNPSRLDLGSSYLSNHMFKVCGIVERLLHLLQQQYRQAYARKCRRLKPFHAPTKAKIDPPPLSLKRNHPLYLAVPSVKVCIGKSTSTCLISGSLGLLSFWSYLYIKKYPAK